MSWRLAWAGQADDYEPEAVLIVCENEPPTIGRQVCRALTELVKEFSGQAITVESNGNTQEHAGVFISLTSQTRVPQPVGPVRRARHSTRMFPGAGP